jgi:hypothetical protein
MNPSLLVFASLLLVSADPPRAVTDKKSQDEPPTGPLTISGQTEILEVTVRRGRAAYVSPRADLTKMAVNLWFRSKRESAGRYFYRMQSLEDISDDTGKMLLTDKRRADLRILRGEIVARESRGNVGLNGPVFNLILDAPARSAKRIRAITGKAQVVEAAEREIRFDGFRKLLGQRLQHEALKDVQIVPSLKTEDGKTLVTLTLTGQPERVLGWFLDASGKRPKELYLTGAAHADSKDQILGYLGTLPDELTLVLRVAERTGIYDFAFDFRDVDLP